MLSSKEHVLQLLADIFPTQLKLNEKISNPQER